MSWAQRYDGTNDYSLFASAVVIPASTPFEIEFLIEYDITKTLILAGNTADTDTQLYLTSSGTLRLRDDAQVLKLYNYGTLLVGYNKFKAVRDISNVVTLFVNDVPVSSNTGVTGVFTFDELNRMSGVTAGTACDYQYLKIDVNGSPVINLDATASAHVPGTPILTDTVGSNDATGVNMPTDGSAWVDLGGSGISITATLGTIEYNSNDTVIGLAGNIDITATLGSINYSSNDTSIQVSGDIDVIATLGTISYASSDTVVSLFGNVDVTATLGTIDYNSNDAGVSLLGGINVNTTLGAIDYASNNTVITLQGQTTITATLGTISYDSNSVIVQIGAGQIIGNVTAGFADNLYSAGFKPSEITVNFKT